jgi:hypothetical protein
MLILLKALLLITRLVHGLSLSLSLADAGQLLARRSHRGVDWAGVPLPVSATEFSLALSLSLSLWHGLWHGLSLSDRWELGIVEAISLTILVGLSCDFGLHLAESYAQSPLTDRKARAMDSVQRMGSPICSAALTTVLGVLPMCFSTLQVTLP